MLPFILQHRMRTRQIVVQQIVQFQFNILGPQFMDLSRPDPIIVVGRRGLDFISPYLSIQTEQSRHRAPKRPPLPTLPLLQPPFFIMPALLPGYQKGTLRGKAGN